MLGPKTGVARHMGASMEYKYGMPQYGMQLGVEEKESRRQLQAKGQLSGHHHVPAQKSKEYKNPDNEPGLPGDYRDICFMVEDRTLYLKFLV